MKKCQCGKHPAKPRHACPYSVEVDGDPSPCSCCDACTQGCATDAGVEVAEPLLGRISGLGELTSDGTERDYDDEDIGEEPDDDTEKSRRIEPEELPPIKSMTRYRVGRKLQMHGDTWTVLKNEKPERGEAVDLRYTRIDRAGGGDTRTVSTASIAHALDEEKGFKRP